MAPGPEPGREKSSQSTKTPRTWKRLDDDFGVSGRSSLRVYKAMCHAYSRLGNANGHSVANDRRRIWKMGEPLIDRRKRREAVIVVQ